MKKLMASGLLLIGLQAQALPLQKQIVPAFVGGIDQHAATVCRQQIKASPCQLKNLLAAYQQCIKKVLVRTPDCRQSLAFFKLTQGGVFHEVKRYQNTDVILADYVYIADQGDGYFLVMKNGRLLSLPLNIPKKVFRSAPHYAEIAKQYPRVAAWQILGFPEEVKLSANRYRLIFTQQLKDGCNACALAGIAKIGYDFSADGKQFFGVQVIQLIPK